MLGSFIDPDYSPLQPDDLGVPVENAKQSQPRLPGKPMQLMPPGQHWQGRRGLEPELPVLCSRLQDQKPERMCEDSSEWPATPLPPFASRTLGGPVSDCRRGLLSSPSSSCAARGARLELQARRELEAPCVLSSFAVAFATYLAVVALAVGIPFCVIYTIGDLTGPPKGLMGFFFILSVIFFVINDVLLLPIAAPIIAINWRAKSSSVWPARATGCIAAILVFQVLVAGLLTTTGDHRLGELLCIATFATLFSALGLFLGWLKLRAVK